jgi:hypothetical protein
VLDEEEALPWVFEVTWDAIDVVLRGCDKEGFRRRWDRRCGKETGEAEFLGAWKHRLSFSGSPPPSGLRVRSSESD